MLHEFLKANREELIDRTRTMSAGRASRPGPPPEINVSVPMFIDQLAETLGRDATPGSARRDSTATPEIGATAAAHGGEWMRRGFSVEQVVRDYGDVCQAVTELAIETKARITTEEFHTLNRCLDEAIARAVTEFDAEKQRRSDASGIERMGNLTHELRNLVATANLSFDILRKGTVGVAGATGAVHQRALDGLTDLVKRSLAVVRLDANMVHRERVNVRAFIEGIWATSALQAQAQGHRFTVIPPSENDLAVDVDAHILASVISNLIQNAFKFSRADSNIVLRGRSDGDSVMLDVEDECGGLPRGEVTELFAPFERRDAKRTGLGLGLSISREGARANGGELTARDVPGHGCVFTVRLPRQRLTAPAPVPVDSSRVP